LKRKKLSVALLELKNVSKNFGKLQAVSNLDFTVAKGDVHTLIGPNGAGKTTVFNLITGIFPLTSGRVLFDGEDITSLESHQIAQRGIARSFQQTFLFMQSTVLENILIGFHMHCKAGALKEFLPHRKRQEDRPEGKTGGSRDNRVYGAEWSEK